MEIPAELPELGQMIPVLFQATLIEWNKQYWVRMKLSEIPAHELVRVGFKLYEVGDYDPEMEAFKVYPFNAAVSERDLEWLASR